MTLDLDKLHEYKSTRDRNNGKSVDAIVDVVGKVMVTQNMVVPFIIEKLDWERHLSPMFYNLVVDHFKEQPIIYGRDTWWGIEGYSTRVKLISDSSDKSWRDQVRGYITTTPTFDLNWEL
jgi:hypothetical protein